MHLGLRRSAVRGSSAPRPADFRLGDSNDQLERKRLVSSMERKFFLLLVLLGGLAGRAVGEAGPSLSVEDLHVVDCMLPGKVRQLGRRTTYLTSRRPVRTTAIDCQVRGGEYTAFDRADYRSAIAVWQSSAEEGDSQAQYYLGQIYERGLGAEPDLNLAAEWYRRAAENGSAAAQVALGFLYESGRGVERDPQAALNLYMQASGLGKESVVLEAEEAERLRQEADAASSLREEIEELRGQLRKLETDSQSGQKEISQLRSEILRLERRASSNAGQGVLGGSLKLGKHYALVVGNSHYASLPDLETAASDAQQLAALLERRFGFETRLLVDATRYQILTAINDLRGTVTEQDSLLVFYSGHGSSDGERQQGWWLPVDAEPNSRANWILNRVISDQLDAISARHVLVVADSAYEGSLTRSSIPTLPQGMSVERRREHLRAMAARRARLALTSGLDQPAGRAGQGLTFARALLETLGNSSGVVEAAQVYRSMATRLGEEAAEPPRFAPMKWARHEGADFLFVARD